MGNKINCFKINKIFIILLLLVSLFLVNGCSKKEVTVILQSNNNIELYINDTYEVKFDVQNCDNYELVYDYDMDVISIENNIITALSEGSTSVEIIFVSSEKTETFYLDVVVNIVEPESIEVDQNIIVYLGKPHQLEWKILPEKASQDVVFKSYNGAFIRVSNGGLITAKSLGKTRITIQSEDYPDIEATIEVEIKRPDVEEITSESSLTLNYKDSYQLEWTVSPQEAIQDVVFEVEEENIVSIDNNGLIYANCPGTTTIKILSTDSSGKYFEIPVTVNGPKSTELLVEENVEIELGEQYLLSFEVKPADAYPIPKFTVSDNTGIEVNNHGVLVGLKQGKYTIDVTTYDGADLHKTINVTVGGSDKPIIVIDKNSAQDLVINWNKPFEVTQDVRAFDGKDGELTLNMEIDGDVDTTTYGTYVVKYKVTDSDGNTTELQRNIEVVWNYAVKFVGHAGSFYGAMNSEEAILYAATVLKYQAIEIDLKQTKDGVFVLSHDPTFGNYTLEACTWEELKDVTITAKRSGGLPEGGTYEAKLCSLERYLEICKQYNITAVIELKTSKGISNWTEQHSPQSSRMPDLIKQIEEAGMINNVIFLTSQYECLAWTRRNGYDFIECQYLVSSCESETYLETCKKYDLDISMNVRDNTKNSDEWLKKYKDAGLKIACYTFEQYATYEDIQREIDRGFDYVTTDWHVMSECDLPELE